MRRLTFLLAILLAAPTAAASSAAELLQQVRESAQATARADQVREKRFEQRRDRQLEALRAAEQKLRVAQARAERARAENAAARQAIAQIKARVEAAAGSRDAAYTVARWAAADLHDRAETSFVALDDPGRADFLAHLAGESTLPTVAELEKLWRVYQRELDDAGRVERIATDYRDAEGARRHAAVTRIGAFTAFTDGHYLTMLPGRGLAELPRSPGWRESRIARAFERAERGFAPALIDPSGGPLLVEYALRPGLFERLWNSGVGGYFIAGVGVLALLLVALQIGVLRDRVLLDEQSVSTVVAVMLLFALLQWWLTSPGAGPPQAPPVTTVTLVNPQQQPPESESESEPPPQPPGAPPSLVRAELPSAAMAVAPLNPGQVSVPVQLGGGSLTGSGLAGFARGAGGGGYGRGQGFTGKPLIPLSTARPQMPEWACKQNIRGWVEVVFEVLPNGRVQNIRIVDAEPKGVYEQAAIESVANWIYPPASSAHEVKQRIPMDPADCAYNWR